MEDEGAEMLASCTVCVQREYMHTLVRQEGCMVPCCCDAMRASERASFTRRGPHLSFAKIGNIRDS